MTLLDALRATGLTVHAVPGWGTNGDHWPVGGPFGIMHHHTTAPIPYPISWLDGTSDGRVKCNVNIKQDGTVWLVNGRTCNFASGPGSAVVLSETKKNIAPPANARDRGLADTTVGNRYYFNIENDHLGTGGPLPEPQHAAIISVTDALLGFYGLKPNQTISHAEWTARKVDPFWDGSTRTVEQIRLELLDMPTAEEIAQAVWSFPAITGNSHMHLQVDRIYRNVNDMILAHRANKLGAAANVWGHQPGDTSAYQYLIRTYAAAIELVTAHKAGKLGTTAFAEIADDDLEAIAKAVNDEKDRRARSRLAT